MGDGDISSTPQKDGSIHDGSIFNLPDAFLDLPPGQVQFDSSASTLKKSDKEALAELFLAMQFPGLVPPSVVLADLSQLKVSGDKGAIDAVTTKAAVLQLDMLYEQTKNDIISSMWDNFINSVRELEKLSKEDYIKKWVTEVAKDGPKSGAEYFAFLLALSASERDHELGADGSQGVAAVSPLAAQFNTMFSQWFADPVENVSIDTRNGNFPDPSFIAGTLASSPDAVRAAIGMVGVVAGLEIAGQTTVNPAADALMAVGPNTGLPVDTQAAVALMAALLYQGAANKSNIDTIAQAIGAGKPPQDLDFAMNYAKNIMAIVTHNLEGSEGAQPQNQTVRMMLGVMALNLLYRQVFKGMSGPEFADLLKPGGTKGILDKVPGMDPSVKAEAQGLIDQLVAQIKSYLPTDEPSRTNMIASLNEYIESNQSTDELLSTTREFAANLGAGPRITQGRIEGAVG